MQAAALAVTVSLKSRVNAIIHSFFDAALRTQPKEERANIQDNHLIYGAVERSRTFDLLIMKREY